MNAPVLKKEVQLHLAHFSMQFSDTPKQMKHDTAAIFERAQEREYAWITGTEAGPGKGGGNPLGELLHMNAEKANYRYYRAKGQDCWIAVSREMINGGWSVDYEKVVDGVTGRYTDKGAIAVSFDSDYIGARATVAAGHYLTKGRPGAASPEYGQNLNENKRIANAIGRYAREMGKGRDVFFYGGDQNITDRTDDTFLGNPLTSCWDEMEKWANTGHGSIDVIASYDHDKRVRCIGCRPLDDKEFFLFSDHYGMEADYAVGVLAA